MSRRGAVRCSGSDSAAYVVTPVHWNAVIVNYNFSTGGVQFDNAIPISDATASLNVPIFIYYHSLNFFGRSANITASLPYGEGHFQGKFLDNETKVYRSGLLDSFFRFAVNIKGGSAMSLREFQSWQQKLILGVSLKVVAPTEGPTKTGAVEGGWLLLYRSPTRIGVELDHRRGYLRCVVTQVLLQQHAVLIDGECHHS